MSFNVSVVVLLVTCNLVWLGHFSKNSVSDPGLDYTWSIFLLTVNWDKRQWQK